MALRPADVEETITGESCSLHRGEVGCAQGAHAVLQGNAIRGAPTDSLFYFLWPVSTEQLSSGCVLGSGNTLGEPRFIRCLGLEWGWGTGGRHRPIRGHELTPINVVLGSLRHLP